MQNKKMDIHIKGNPGNESHEYLFEKINGRDKSRFYKPIDYLATAVRKMEEAEKREAEYNICFRVADLTKEDLKLVTDIILEKTRHDME